MKRVLGEELDGLHIKFELIRLLLGLIPDNVGQRLRAALLRFAGFHISRGVVVAGTPRIGGPGNIYPRLCIGRRSFVNTGCIFDLGDTIRIGRGVAVGHGVAILTTTHQLGTVERRAGRTSVAPVSIGDGAWIGARSVILPGVCVGPGSIVAAGAVVTADVPANSMVGGVPARVLRAELPNRLQTPGVPRS